LREIVTYFQGNERNLNTGIALRFMDEQTFDNKVLKKTEVPYRIAKTTRIKYHWWFLSV
jgi:hypothetical protein